MKLSNIFGLALDFIYKKRVSYLLSIAIGVILFYFFDLNILSYDNIYYVRECVEDTFSNDINEIYYVHYEGVIDEQYREFYKKLYKLNGMNSYGTFADGSTWFWEKDVDYSKYFYIEDEEWEIEEDENALIQFDIYASCINMLDIKDIDGRPLTDIYKDAAAPIYIGIEYQDTLPIGTILKEPYVSGDIPEGTPLEDIEYEYREYYVAGVIAGNQEILYTDIIEEQDGILKSLDKAVICVKDTGEYSDASSFYFTSDNASEVKDDINKLAQEYGLNIDILTVDKMLDNMQEEQFNNVKYKGIMFALILAMAIISLSSTSVIMLVTRKNEIGILYANGVTAGNMKLVIIIINMLCTFISAAIAFTIKTFAMNNTYIDMPKYFDMYMDIRLRYVSVQMGILAFIIGIISSIISVKIIKRYSVRELIGNN